MCISGFGRRANSWFGREKDGEREREKYFLSYFLFSMKLSSEEFRTFIFSKLSSDTKGQPVVLLPHYNWIHCELSYLECSLCLYVYAWTVPLHMRTSLCNIQGEGWFCLQGIQLKGFERASSRFCLCLVQSIMWLGTSDFFFLQFKMNSSTLSLFCKMSEVKRASGLVAMHLSLRDRERNDCQYAPLNCLWTCNQTIFATMFSHHQASPIVMN